MLNPFQRPQPPAAPTFAARGPWSSSLQQVCELRGTHIMEFDCDKEIQTQ